MENIAAKAANDGSNKKTAAVAAIKLTLDAIANDLFKDALNDSVMQRAKTIVQDAQLVNEQMDRIRIERKRLEDLFTRTASMKTSDMDEPAQNALMLFSSILSTVGRIFAGSPDQGHRLDSKVQLETIRASSYIIWAYLGGSGKPSELADTTRE
ncbi:MAG: hypothetical protein EB117_11320 [Betaproteobacteria bacterium]|nr:hypothetical protein [Betaproteobacteria bacterium]